MHVDLINVAYLMACVLIRSSWRCTFWMMSITLYQHKLDNYIIIASLKSKLINWIPGLPLLISILPGFASRMHVETLDRPGNSTSVLEGLPGKLDIKRHSPSILYFYSPINRTLCWYMIILNLKGKMKWKSNKNKNKNKVSFTCTYPYFKSATGVLMFTPNLSVCLSTSPSIYLSVCWNLAYNITQKLFNLSRWNFVCEQVAMCWLCTYFICTVKPVLSNHSKRRPKVGYKPDYRLMQVKSIAECSIL